MRRSRGCGIPSPASIAPSWALRDLRRYVLSAKPARRFGHIASQITDALCPSDRRRHRWRVAPDVSGPNHCRWTDIVNFDAKIGVSRAKRCSGNGFVREIAIILTTVERNVRQLLICEWCLSSGAGLHDPVEGAGEVALEAAGGLARGFAFGGAAGDVVAGGLVHAAAGHRDGVQSGVGGAVAAAVEAVAGGAAAAGGDGVDAAEGGEGGLGTHAAMV